MNLRGQIISVYDLRAKLGLPRQSPDAAGLILIVDTPNGSMGALVDSVESVQEIPRDQISESAGGKDPVAKLPGGLVLVIDLSAQFPKTESKVVEAA